MFNNITFAGRLTADALLKYDRNGNPFLLFTLAQNEYGKEDSVIYMPFIQFFKDEEWALKKMDNMKKGNLIGVTASLYNRKDKNGYDTIALKAITSYLLHRKKDVNIDDYREEISDDDEMGF